MSCLVLFSRGRFITLRRYPKVRAVIRDIPPEVFVASGLGSWRRSVINLSTEPGALACRAYLQVVHRVLTPAESALEEQSRVADCSAAEFADGPAGGDRDGIGSDSD